MQHSSILHLSSGHLRVHQGGIQQELDLDECASDVVLLEPSRPVWEAAKQLFVATLMPQLKSYQSVKGACITNNPTPN